MRELFLTTFLIDVRFIMHIKKFIFYHNRHVRIFFVITKLISTVGVHNYSKIIELSETINAIQSLSIKHCNIAINRQKYKLQQMPVITCSVLVPSLTVYDR